MKLSQDAIEAAREQLHEHTEAMKPKNNLAASVAVGDWTKTASGSCLPPFDVSAARAAVHARLAAQNAARQKQ